MEVIDAEKSISYVGGKQNLTQLALFFQSYATVLKNELARACEIGDKELIRHQLHKIKGAFGNFAADAAISRLEKFERKLENPTQIPSDEIKKTVTADLLSVAHALRRIN